MDDPDPRPPADAPTLTNPGNGALRYIDRYRILDCVGAGGMGTVFRAEDPQLQRIVALKVPPLYQVGHRAAAVERFLREARAAAAVHHPNVCPIHDLGEHEGVPYVVMPFVEGP